MDREKIDECGYASQWLDVKPFLEYVKCKIPSLVHSQSLTL